MRGEAIDSWIAHSLVQLLWRRRLRAQRIDGDNHLSTRLYIHALGKNAAEASAIRQNASSQFTERYQQQTTSWGIKSTRQTRRATLFAAAILEVAKRCCAHASSSHAMPVVGTRRSCIQTSVRTGRCRGVVRGMTRRKACSYASETIGLLLGRSLSSKELLTVLLRCGKRNAM